MGAKQDLAETATTYTYDDRRRVHTVLTSRAPPNENWPGEPSGPGTYQMVLQDDQFFYDVVNNPTEIRDNRIEQEWPEGAKPVHRKIQYDDLYRATRIDYEYATGDDAWKSPFEAELEGNGDPRRAQPSPHVEFAKRVLWQSYSYDWLGNNAETYDDAAGFYDRSLGTIDNGPANAGPYQLRGANNTSEGNGDDDQNQTGSLSAEYDVSGNLTRLALSRGGACTSPNGACNQSFLYHWDELGRLVHAKRWDGTSAETNFNASGFDADLKYVYAAGDQRVIKTATQEAPGTDPQVHTLYIYPSLELRRSVFGNGTQDYTRDGDTEVGYLFANGVRLARLVNELAASGADPEIAGTLRVFFELGDHLGSTSAALDKETGQLVERATYQAYGARESDYRPTRFGEFREDYGFTGKEEDVEVGLTYFGKRFYAPALQRWISADPLEVHALKSGEPNIYAYVSGQALRATDPLGLKCGEDQSCDAGKTYETWSQDWANEQNSANAEVRALEEKFRNEDSAAFAENKAKFDAGARDALGAQYQAASDRLAAASAALSVADNIRNWLHARIDAQGESVTLQQANETAAALVRSNQIFQSYIAPMILGRLGPAAPRSTGSHSGRTAPEGPDTPARSAAEGYLRAALKRQGLDRAPAGFKEKWSESGFEYEVRIHPADPAHGKSGGIYRVARRAQGLDAKGQGSGWEYIDDRGTWHPTRTLKPGKPDSPNSEYNEEAARNTHITVPGGS